MTNLEEIAMPMPDGVPIEHPELVSLRWNGVATALYIGQICYLKRDTTAKSRVNQSINPSSLSARRMKTIGRLISVISEIQTLKVLRPHTMYEYVSAFLRFMNWSDKRQYYSALCVELETEKFVAEYFDELRDLVSKNQFSHNRASAIQRAVLTILRLFFNEEFCASVRTLRYNASRNVPTEIPDEKRQGRRFSVATSLFSKICSVILDFEPYPFEIQISSKESVWLFPTRVRKSPGSEQDTLAWNIKTGELHSLDYVKSKSKSRDPYSSAWTTINNAKTHLNEVNNNPKSFIRKSHAVTAVLAFAVLFSAETGINPSQLVNLSWHPDQMKEINSASVTRQKFREVKFRASGKTISTQLSIGFTPKLKKYLELRTYLLGKQTNSKLFITLNIHGKHQGIKTNFTTLFDSRIASLRIPLPHVTSRQWRAAKQDSVLRREGPVVAARVMNHTVRTTVKAYSNGTHAAHLEEMGAYLSNVENAIVTSKKRKGRMSSVGACAEFQKPEAISQEVAIQPNCNSSEGCLFCSKYRVHADSIDIRKLLSCRYCIRITSNRAKSMEEYDKTFGSILRRIDFLILEISKHQKALVMEIEHDVDINGNLDSFWANKLELLFELELA